MRVTSIIILLALTGFTNYSIAQKKVVKKTILTKPKSTTTAVAAGNGALLYKQYCLSCHQADGGGVSNMNPPLVKTNYVLGDKVRLANIILNGFSERVEIEGEMYSNVMPAFNYLTNQQIADVLTYVRSNFTNKASAVSAAEVNKVRTGK
jgi:mono/diheme cytochrome c family protein